MRTAFSGICLFNDTFSKKMAWFYMQQKRVGRELCSRETEREGESVAAEGLQCGQ